MRILMRETAQPSQEEKRKALHSANRPLNASS